MLFQKLLKKFNNKKQIAKNIQDANSKKEVISDEKQYKEDFKNSDNKNENAAAFTLKTAKESDTGSKEENVANKEEYFFNSEKESQARKTHKR